MNRIKIIVCAALIALIIITTYIVYTDKDEHMPYMLQCEIVCLDDSDIFVTKIDNLPFISNSYKLLYEANDGSRKYRKNDRATVVMRNVKEMPSTNITINWGYTHSPKDIKETHINWEYIPFNKTLSLYFIFYQGKWHMFADENLNITDYINHI